jgi:hypothetical protein
MGDGEAGSITATLVVEDGAPSNFRTRGGWQLLRTPSPVVVSKAFDRLGMLKRPFAIQEPLDEVQ